MSRAARATAGGMFDRGQYQMGSVPSRHIMERDQKAHGTLRLRSTLSTAAATEEELKRLKRELEAREAKPAATAAAPQLANAKAQAAAFADEDADVSDSSSASSEADDDAAGKAVDGDSDEEAEELKRELAKVKEERERAEMAAAEAAGSNPLLVDTSVRKRWDDDVVFRNQAKDEPQKEKRFINDTIRSECVASRVRGARRHD